ncbi:hypothetical protein N781_17800 [Pontibacillus halophilus JSM 076056 = DSM 19796]|uniref:Uncharacterized protein n=1 Tax=Pontibacillus halophilus JSM 076056 = DSM 19796 TaxID=1385510 RepID=A0A0A5GLX4_9BACI|nr:tetratricopeptide repeat protein [Pontibacillus halophilus]KGX92155.1 hypothetical protein N781_17800 [Pontibacillus halophilus JSM 076056 = DSM 19796]
MHGIEQAIQLLNAGRSEEGIDRLRSELSTAGDEEKYTIAEVFMQFGLRDEARDLLNELKQQYPDEHELTLTLAEIAIDEEDDERAMDLLNTIPEDDEQYVTALVQLADLYQTQGLFEVAEQKLLTAKQYEPSEPVIDFALGELAFSTGDYQKSIPYYEKALRRKDNVGEAQIPLRLAEAYATQGDFDQALDYFQATDEHSPDILFRYGFTAYQANRLDIAIRVWKKLVDEDPFYQSVYPLLSEALETEGMMEDAFATAKEGIAKDEYNKELYHMAGQQALRLGDTQEGYRLVRNAITLDPGYKEAVLYLVDRYKEDGDYEAVKDLLDHVIEMGEDDPIYKWELALAESELENYKEALNHYDDAYNSFKDDADFLKEYGYFLVEEGRVQQAAEVLGRYLTIEPMDVEIQSFVSRLNSNEEG